MDTPSGPEIDQLGLRIDEIPELSGAGIGFLGDDACTLLRESTHSSGLRTYVLLQEDDAPGPPEVPVERPSILPELLGIGFNCTGAVFAWAALGGEGIATAASGGAAAVLMPVTYMAAGATSIQCVNSLVRASDITFHNGDWTRWLDSHQSYIWMGRALDVISLAGAAISATAAIRAVQAIERATGRSWTVILKGLSRAERKRLAEELIRLKKPGISGRDLKDLVTLGTFPKRLEAAEITKRLFYQLKDAISATLALGGSGTTGLLNSLVVHVVLE